MYPIISFILAGSAGKPMLCDLRIPERAAKPPLLVFMHGFKGFKDWGHFNAAAEAFYRQGIAVLKFNFSHNGTTPEAPLDFADLEAFGKNTFSLELDDLQMVIDHCFTAGWSNRVDLGQLVVLGHSRGGGIAILQAVADERVKKVITWASVSDYEPRVNLPELETWKKNGVIYQRNTRTGQEMPLDYTLYTDFYTSRPRLDIPEALRRLTQPLLLLHGTADSSVLPAEAEAMKQNCPHAELVFIESADHTFGGKHPFTESELPFHTAAAIEKSVRFIK